jgi:hypothetical protein
VARLVTHIFFHQPQNILQPFFKRKLGHAGFNNAFELFQCAQDRECAFPAETGFQFDKFEGALVECVVFHQYVTAAIVLVMFLLFIVRLKLLFLDGNFPLIGGQGPFPANQFHKETV